MGVEPDGKEKQIPCVSLDYFQTIISASQAPKSCRTVDNVVADVDKVGSSKVQL